ncbi:MAG: hypothetical protein LDL18_08355, partial [Zymomonas sp.]|nr:hypothetical protein [Zymomonas sp.]
RRSQVAGRRSQVAGRRSQVAGRRSQVKFFKSSGNPKRLFLPKKDKKRAAKQGCPLFFKSELLKIKLQGL